MKKLNTTRFGQIDITDEHVIDFHDGMIGFERFKKYVLIESPEMPLVLWLQSMEEPSIAFPLMEPSFFRPDYKANVGDANKHRIQLEAGERTKVMLVMTIPADMTSMTVNLKAPVIFNLGKSKGIQTILQDRNLEVRCPAHEHFSRAVSNLAPEISDSSVDSAVDSTVDSNMVNIENWKPVDVREVRPQGAPTASV